MKRVNDDLRQATDDGMTRRELVEKTSAVAGGLLLGGTLAGCGAEPGETGAAPGVRASGSDKLKLALVGCGGRGTGAANNALKADVGTEIVAVADVFADKAESCVQRLQAKFGQFRAPITPETTFVGLEAYKQAIDQADVVLLATPGGFRPEHFAYAVSRNKHVFMEKPVATDAPGIRRVLDTARVADQRKLNVVVGLQRRYDPAYRETVQRYRDGEVGQIVSGQVYWNWDGMDSRVSLRQPQHTELEYQLRNWYYFTWLSGDHILEQNLHNIDIANWIIGEYPQSAQGSGGRQVRNGKEHGQIFDHHFVEYVYPSGAIVHAQCRQITGCMKQVKEQFQATDGSIETMAILSGNSRMTRRDGTEVYRNRGLLGGSPYQREHDALFKAIRSGEHLNNVEYAAKSTFSAIMGRMATYSGERIAWEKALASDLRLVPDSSALDWNGEAPVMPDAEGRYPVAIPGSTRVI